MALPVAPGILGTATALPGSGATQEELLADLQRLWAGRSVDVGRLEGFHRHAGVKKRHFALPLSKRRTMTSFAERNRLWGDAASALAERALVDALSKANLAPQELDHLIFVTSTGVALPGLDARLANRLRMTEGLVRWPLTSFGCLGGGAGLVRASQILRAFPGQLAALVAVELFSFTLQLEDVGDANLVASGLFGDGAAAVILGGGSRPQSGKPKIIATRSVLIPDTDWAMGWDVRDTGLGVVLSQKVPMLVRNSVRGPVDSFLASQGVRRSKIAHWIVHPGGPKILDAIVEALELPPEMLRRSRASLEEVGNLSAASVLNVLDRTLADAEARVGDLGLLLAVGPGLGAELALLRW